MTVRRESWLGDSEGVTMLPTVQEEEGEAYEKAKIKAYVEIIDWLEHLSDEGASLEEAIAVLNGHLEKLRGT